jgi:hypothetical protein
VNTNSDQKNWRVEATLSSPLAGEAPMLDAILEFEMSQRTGKAYKITRDVSCPPAGDVHLPLLRGSIGGVSGIPRCSSPIAIPLSSPNNSVPITREYYTKRLATEHAENLAPRSRNVVAVGNQTFKSYRIPVVSQCVEKVCWFVGGSKRRNLLSLLDSVKSLGHKRSQGRGRVVKWEAYPVEEDWSWFAPCVKSDGTMEVDPASGKELLVLMRPLPWCSELPKNLVGYRRGFAGVLPPYWHPDRQVEVVLPC